MNNNRGRNQEWSNREGRGWHDRGDQQGWSRRDNDMGRSGNYRYDADDDRRYSSGDRYMSDADDRGYRTDGRSGRGGNGNWRGRDDYQDRGRSHENFPSDRGGAWDDDDRGYPSGRDESRRVYGDENLGTDDRRTGAGFQEDRGWQGDGRRGHDDDRDQGYYSRDYDRGRYSRGGGASNQGGYDEQGGYGRGQGTRMSSRGGYRDQDEDYAGGYRGRGGYGADEEGRRWGSSRRDEGTSYR